MEMRRILFPGTEDGYVHLKQILSVCRPDKSLLVEDHHLTIEEEENEVSKRGKIEVMVQLGRRKRIKSKYSPGHNHVLAQETSKKVAVDRGRSHGISYVDNVFRRWIRPFLLTACHRATPVDFELDEEDEHDYKWMPARGIAGTSITFTFFYASRSKSCGLLGRTSY